MCTNCTRVQIYLHHLESRSKFAPRVQILKTPFIHPGCKFAPWVQICTRVQIAHMNTA